jgi:hypothetical protein
MTSNINESLQAIRPDQFKVLRGKPITLSEACQRYDLVLSTLRSWVGKRYIRVLRPGYQSELDEADVAYCAALYHIRREAGTSKAPLLNPDGTPHLLKYPDLSAERRRRQGQS